MMHDENLDPDVLSVAHTIADLSRGVEPDPRYSARLRQELLRRHQELSADRTQRAAGMLLSRLTGLKRLTLVAPPALAAALILSLAVWGLPISGHAPSQAAVAARITRALAQSAPTVTAWRVTVERQRGDADLSAQCNPRLTSGQRLYVRGDRAYLWSNGAWYEITPSASRCIGGLDWAFATLPSSLAHHRFSVLPSKTIDGRKTDGIRSVVSQGTSQFTSTFWVDHQTGLVVLIQRVQRQAGRVVERDTAHYRYTRTA
jgi:hypothetical protein